MQPTQFTASIQVHGVKIRTSNTLEMNPTSGRIGPLWGKFFQQFNGEQSDRLKIYGVYTNYESDYCGDYDVYIATELEESNSLRDKLNETILIPQGEYLVFSSSGKMPETCIKLWQDIWQYFQQENCPHSRAYSTDFEEYINQDTINIYISLKSL